MLTAGLRGTPACAALLKPRLSPRLKQRIIMKKGRKKLSPDKKKRCQVKSTFTADDFEYILDKAERAKVPISVFVARAAMKAEVVGLLTKEELTLLKNLYKIGVNLNQIAKHLNGDPTWPCYRQLQDEIRELSSLRRKLMEVINRKK